MNVTQIFFYRFLWGNECLFDEKFFENNKEKNFFEICMHFLMEPS